MSARAQWTALLLTLLSLVALAVINQVVPYGWKIFVLTKIFKIAWAASIALVLAASTVDLFGRLMRAADATAHLSVPLQLTSAIAAALVALVALGYLLPDWNPWTEAIAVVVIGLWAILLFVPISARKMLTRRR